MLPCLPLRFRISRGAAENPQTAAIHSSPPPAFRKVSISSRPVHFLMLSSQVFLCLLLFRLLFTQSSKAPFTQSIISSIQYFRHLSIVACLNPYDFETRKYQYFSPSFSQHLHKKNKSLLMSIIFSYVFWSGSTKQAPH